MAYFQEALKELRPGKEFSTYEDESIIVWNDESVITPTQEEIQMKIKELEKKDKALMNSVLKIKQSAIAKLAALGLTEDEAKAITG
jgi:hypothetical protein